MTHKRRKILYKTKCLLLQNATRLSLLIWYIFHANFPSCPSDTSGEKQKPTNCLWYVVVGDAQHLAIAEVISGWRPLFDRHGTQTDFKEAATDHRMPLFLWEAVRRMKVAMVCGLLVVWTDLATRWHQDVASVRDYTSQRDFTRMQGNGRNITRWAMSLATHWTQRLLQTANMWAANKTKLK